MGRGITSARIAERSFAALLGTMFVKPRSIQRDSSILPARHIVVETNGGCGWLCFVGVVAVILCVLPRFFKVGAYLARIPLLLARP